MRWLSSYDVSNYGNITRVLLPSALTHLSGDEGGNRQLQIRHPDSLQGGRQLHRHRLRYGMPHISVRLLQGLSSGERAMPMCAE